MHQVVEYILGGVLVAQGLQSPTPAMPAIAGGLIMANAAIARGPLAAFRLVTRTQHRFLDVVVIALVVAFGVQPWIDVEGTTRLIMIVIAGVMAFVWWQSSFLEKPKRHPGRAPITVDGGRGVEIGRLAGRAMGDGINAAKRLREARKRTGSEDSR